MRVVGGELRGRRLESPDGRDIRPTSDRAREALFNLLMHGPYDGPEGPLPRGLDVIDVFAGSGAMGIEALSRGASRATFIENDREAVRLIRHNLEGLELGTRAEVLPRDALAPGLAPRAHALAFLDAPYRSGLSEPALEALAGNGWLTEDALCIVEVSKAETLTPPEGFAIVDERRYGAAHVYVLQHRGTT